MRKQKRKSYPGDLTDYEWDEVKNIIKEDVYCGPKGRTKYPRREMFDAIFYVLRTGCQWTDLPHDFPPWKSVYAQYLRWRDKQVFEKLNDHLHKLIRKKLGRGELATIGIADSQSVKTTEKRGSLAMTQIRELRAGNDTYWWITLDG